MNKTIGLFIQPGHLLSNGITQQGHYTKLALDACGYNTQLISTEQISEYNELGHNVEVVSLDTNMSKFSIIIFVSALITSTDSQNCKFLQKAKCENVKLVNLICGNIFYLYQEEIIFDVHHILKSNVNEFLDEIWVLPMYEYSVQMLETFFKKPVKVVPYIWNSDILHFMWKKMHNNNSLPYYKKTVPNDLVTLFSVEPNMSVHKNAFVPMMACESYFHKFNKLKSMCVLCGKKLRINDLHHYLTFIKQGKLELYDRLPFIDLLGQSLKNNLPTPVVISHQYLNDLNFVHFETLYLGWPLVHNCDRLINVGYFYNKDNVNDASLQIEYARLNHSEVYDKYMKNVHEFLEKYNPKNSEVSKIYKNRIENLVS